MSIPARFRTHTISIEPYLGSGAYGAVYGPPVDVVCRVEEGMRMVRASSGDEVVSSAMVFCDPDVTIPTESRVTVNGRVTTVLSVSNPSVGSRLDHLEVALV